MTEPNVIRCLICKQSFDRSVEGTQDFFDHRKDCARATLNHPSNHKPTGAA